VGKAPSKEMRLISPNGKKVIIKGTKNSWAVSRFYLDKFLVDKAVEKGAKLIKKRVIDIERKDNRWIIKTDKKIYKSDIIIGADGANSLVRRKLIGTIPEENLGLCYGCFARSNEKEFTTIKFLEKKQGYAWCFPREDHLSIGVGMELNNSKNIKEIFDDFISSYYPHVKIISKWGAVIPLVKNSEFFKISCAGENWILVGDAAGHVDPITGEGITYALWSAKLASQSLLKKDLKEFDVMWRNEYGYNLVEGSKIRDLFFNKNVLELSAKMALKSETYGKILYDLINSTQDYKTFTKRIIYDTPKIIGEMIF